jgi:NAD(P)-dependent dehydrogenase (short-subunit alcohol dehydrogenase family)
MIHKRTQTSEGLETNFAVNSFGPYVLTELLIPTLAQSVDARVVRLK